MPELRMKKQSAFNFISEYKLVFKFIGIKISGDTDQTTLELKKLNNKNESKD